jgi:hypothetical protein
VAKKPGGLSADEIAAIKAENSRAHRAAQTLRYLIWALVATLAVVLFLVFVVVRPEAPPREPVDYGSIAAEVQGDLAVSIVAPVLPEGWSANEAQLRTAGEIPVWYIGFITPEQQFIALNQGVDANPTWVDNLLESAEPTGSLVIGNLTWTVYDHRDADDPGNLAYALVTETQESTFVLYGTATDTEFETLATALELG